MPRLFVLSGPDVGKSVAFEGEVDLGRSPEVAVVLRSPAVSRRHARIVPAGDFWWLEDLGSINGTTMAGRRVEREQLVDGSLFQLGDLELRFRLDAEAGERGGSGTTVLEGDESGDGDDAPDQLGDASGGADAFELEGDWDVTASAPARRADPSEAERTRSPGLLAARANAGAAARAGLEATQVHRGQRTTASGGRVLQYKKVADREGFLVADLSQYPLWVRTLVTLLLVALFVALTWGAFHLTATLRGRGSAEVNLESSP